MDTFSQSKIEQRIAVSAVVEKMPADLLTPLSVYLKLAQNSSNAFLLESVEGGENLARFSFIGTDPETVLTGKQNTTEITSKSTKHVVDTTLFEYLRQHFERYEFEHIDGLPSFSGGAIGFFGYQCSKWFEPSLNSDHEAGDDVAAFMLFRCIVAFDHVRQTVNIVSLVFHEEAMDTEVMKEKARQNNLQVRRILESGELYVPIRNGGGGAEVSSNWKRDEFEEAVDKIKELIAAGECYQVVLSQQFSKHTSADPVSVYRAIRSVNPSPYMFLLKFEDKAIIGASPEMLVKCRDRYLEYRPIAGTRPRGKTMAEDETLAEEMKVDRKEVAEHLMLVDLGRNDLGRVASYGSVKVRELMNVEKYSHVQHLVSSLTAELRPEFDQFDALAACFPAGTVSGAPKVRALELIDGLEPTPRGVYSGAVGYFDYSGNMDTCIAIRTLVLKRGVATVQAGAGIVADSVPSHEYEETVNKARAMLQAIEIAETGEY